MGICRPAGQNAKVKELRRSSGSGQILQSLDGHCVCARPTSTDHRFASFILACRSSHSLLSSCAHFAAEETESAG